MASLYRLREGLPSSSLGLFSVKYSSPFFLSTKQHLPFFDQKRFFGAGEIKAVGARMKSVKSIQKITKAMKMVAASKLRQDQRRLENGLPFSLPVRSLMERLPQETDKKGDIALIALSSDKGLCGGLNSFVAKEARILISENEALGNKVQIYGVGDKIRSALHRLFGDRFAVMFADCTKLPWNFTVASIIAERILNDKPQRLALLYNHFKSVISYDTLRLNLVTMHQASKMSMKELDNFEFEPERSDVWKDMHDFYVASTIYGCMLDNIASEQSARMSAMDNASSNASDMLSSLTLKYNRARQAKITTELVEIISGANAV